MKYLRQNHELESVKLHFCLSDKAYFFSFFCHVHTQCTDRKNDPNGSLIQILCSKEKRKAKVSYWRCWRFPTFTFEDTMKRMKVGAAGIHRTNRPGYRAHGLETNEHEPPNKVSDNQTCLPRHSRNENCIVRILIGQIEIVIGRLKLNFIPSRSNKLSSTPRYWIYQFTHSHTYWSYCQTTSSLLVSFEFLSVNSKSFLFLNTTDLTCFYRTDFTPSLRFCKTNNLPDFYSRFNESFLFEDPFGKKSA